MLPRSVQDKLHALSQTYKIDGREEKGANGWVFFAVNKVTGVSVAIKFYYWGDEPDLHAEPRSLAQFNSPHIVPILTADLIEDGWACFICPRFASDVETLIDHGGVAIHRALDIAMDVLSAVGTLHAAGIVHRDLKPANILLAEGGMAAVGDFGSVASIDIARGTAPASKHSILYCPPESCDAVRYFPAGDIYQVGVVLYELLGGALSKDPSAWLTLRQREECGGLESECDQSLFQDDVLRDLITRGKVLKMTSLPFWVSSGIRRCVAKLVATPVDRRLASAGEAMAVLLRRRRETINWVGSDLGAIGTFAGGAARIAVSGIGHRVELNRGRGWRRDSSLEMPTPKDSCRAIDLRFA